jgi:hypothetical protein
MNHRPDRHLPKQFSFWLLRCHAFDLALWHGLAPDKALCRLTIMGGTIDRLASRPIQRAARSAPYTVSERLEEEWLADMSEQRGRISRLRFALGCCWAVMVIRRDDCTARIPATGSEIRTNTMMGFVNTGEFDD